MRTKALAGVKVLELSQFVAGSYCTSLFAHLGAEVVKVEPPGKGDCLRHVGPFLKDDPNQEKSGLFLYLNQNKQGITLDINTKKGQEIFLKLLEDFDILIEDVPPSQGSELGLNYDKLQNINPRLIITSITPFGQNGPYKDYKAYDINIQAASGLAGINGEPDKTPLRIPGMQAHFQSALNGAIGTLSALFFREISGEGQHVDISEQECCASILGDVMSNASMLNRVRTRSQSLADMGTHSMIWPIGNFETKDGYVNICILESHQWKGLVEAFGNPEWALDPKLSDMYAFKEYDDTEGISEKIETTIKSYDTETLFQNAQRNRVPLVAIKNTSAVLTSPQLIERDFFKEIEHLVAGKLTYPGAPFRLSETPWSFDRPAPLLGQHNEIIYSKLGYSKADLKKLSLEKVI